MQIKIKDLGKKRKIVESLLNNKVDLKEAKETNKKILCIKTWLKNYDNAIEDISLKYLKDLQEKTRIISIETATEYEGKLIHDDKVGFLTNKEQTLIRNERLAKLNNDIDIAINEEIVEFEPIIINDEKVIKSVDLFTRQELSGILFDSNIVSKLRLEEVGE